MNYETYETLSPKQKEEYDFRFRLRVPIVDASKVISWAVVLIMTSLQLLFLSYLIMTGEDFVNLRDQVGDMFQTGFKVYQSLGTIIIFVLLWQSVDVLLFQLKEKRWCRKNKVKKVWGWPFKRWNK